MYSSFTLVGEEDVLTLDHEAELEQALRGVVMEVEAKERKPVSSLAVSILPVCPFCTDISNITAL